MYFKIVNVYYRTIYINIKIFVLEMNGEVKTKYFNGLTAARANWLVQIFATLFNIKYSNGVAEWDFCTVIPVN